MATITQLSKYRHAGIDYGTIKVLIPTAEVLTLNGTPVTLIAAPGSGKAIIVDHPSIALKSTFNSVAYATNTNLYIIRQNGNVSGEYLARFNIAFSASTFLSPAALIGLNAINYADNETIKAIVGVGNPTAGNSDIYLYLSYKIITL